MVSSCLIREIRPEDAMAAATLSGELGYPASPEAIRRRIKRLSGSADHAIYVACMSDEVVGWIDVSETRHLVSDPRADICGLVVSSKVRSRGIGRQLLARAEQWAVDRGLTSMVVRSRDAREAAHRFYLREGYTRTKLSVVFGKDLAAGRIAEPA